MIMNDEINELNIKINRILEDCQNLHAKTELTSIYNTLNNENSLQPKGIKEKIKFYFRRFFKNNNEEEKTQRIANAREDIYSVLDRYVITKDTLRDRNVRSNSTLNNEIDQYLELALGIDFSEKSFKRYDITLTEPIKENAYSTVRKQMIEQYFNEDITLKDLVEKRKLFYNNKVKDIKAKCMELEIEPYLGSKNFMEERIKNVHKGILDMQRMPEFSSRQDIKTYVNIINDILEEIQNLKEDSNMISQQKENYNKIEELYKKVLMIEDNLSTDIEKVWKERETPISEYSKDGEFSFLAHVITSEEFDLKNMNKLCMSYITNRTLTLPYGEYGFIYPMKIKNVDSMSNEDSGSWLISKKDFIEQGLPKKWQYTDSIDENGRRIYYEEPATVSKLILPQTMEKQTIDTNAKLNGEILNYDNVMSYNEIVITNKDKDIMPNAVFVKDIKQNKEAYLKAKRLSEKLNLPLIEIDKSICREKLGLQPYTPNEMSRNKFENEPKER